MKVVEIKRIGGPDVLDCVDRPKPQPGPGEVLVRAYAIGVNYFDLMIRTGRRRGSRPRWSAIAAGAPRGALVGGPMNLGGGDSASPAPLTQKRMGQPKAPYAARSSVILGIFTSCIALPNALMASSGSTFIIS